MDDFSKFNPRGYFLSFPLGPHDVARGFLGSSSDAEIYAEYEYISRMAVRDHNKGHIDSFRKKTCEKIEIFRKKSRYKYF